MTIINQKTARKLINNGDAAQVAVMYNASNDTTYGVLNNYKTQRTDHYPIASGDLRDDVPETEPTFR